MNKILVLLTVLLALTGCSGEQPAVNANSNKVEVFSLSRLINVTTINYYDSFSGNSGTVTHTKE